MPDKTPSFFSPSELVTSAVLFAFVVVLGSMHATILTWVIGGLLLVAVNHLIRRWLDGMSRRA